MGSRSATAHRVVIRYMCVGPGPQTQSPVRRMQALEESLYRYLKSGVVVREGKPSGSHPRTQAPSVLIYKRRSPASYRMIEEMR